jgi:serine protease inhibitor
MKFRSLFAAFALMTAAACGEAIVDPPGGIDIPDEDERPFLATELAATSASNQFGITLFKQVAASESNANVLLSPLSASMALGMTMNGAEGTTYDAMRSTLGFGDMDETAINTAYRGLIPQLHARDNKVEFRLANALWYRQGFQVKQPFLDAAATNFFARVTSLDFSDPTAPKTISKWAEDQTGGRIKDLVEQIDPNDVMFLINAVYFKAPWSSPFDPQSTRSAEFTRANGSRVNVPTMTRDGSYYHVIDNQVKIVELMYADSAFSMVLVAPAGNTSLAAFSSSITPATWSSWMSRLQPGRVMLSMPKFKFDYDITMNSALSALGMGVAFDWQLADFDRIHDQTRDDLHISKVRQKAFIDVHELGTEAAAATSVTISVTSMPPELRFDRPFIFAIRERSSGAILFVGRMGDPSAN